MNLRKNELAKVRSTLESFIQVPFSKMAPDGRSHFRKGENGDGVFFSIKGGNTHLGIPQVYSEVVLPFPAHYISHTSNLMGSVWVGNGGLTFREGRRNSL